MSHVTQARTTPVTANKLRDMTSPAAVAARQITTASDALEAQAMQTDHASTVKWTTPKDEAMNAKTLEAFFEQLNVIDSSSEFQSLEALLAGSKSHGSPADGGTSWQIDMNQRVGSDVFAGLDVSVKEVSGGRGYRVTLQLPEE